MTGMTGLPAKDADLEAMSGATGLNVEQVLARRQGSARMAGLAAALWLAGVALFAAIRLTFARARRSRGLATGLTIMLALVVSAFLAALVFPERESMQAAEAATPPPVAASPVAEPVRSELVLAARSETWQPVRRPFGMYHVEAPELEQAELAHRVAMRERGARQDSFLWTNSQPKAGSLQRPVVHLVIERFEHGLPTARPLFPDLAMRAAEIGVSIDRLQRADEIVTKFGAMQVADAMLDSDRARLPCLVFRRIDAVGLVMAGWYCGTAERPADRVAFTCFIDRVDLVGAGQDQTLRRLFAQAEQRRRGCPSVRQPGRKMTWLDHEAPVPALKLSQRGR